MAPPGGDGAGRSAPRRCCCARAAMQPPRHRGDRRASRCAAAGPCGRRRALAGLRAARKGRKAEAAADDAAERRARKGRRSRRRHLPGCRARGRCRPAPRDLAAPGRFAAHAKQLAMRSCETARTSARAPPCSAARGGAAEPARACRVRRRAGPPAGALQGGGGRRDDTKAGRPLVGEGAGSLARGMEGPPKRRGGGKFLRPNVRPTLLEPPERALRRIVDLVRVERLALAR